MADNRIYIPCHICGDKPATEIKGGIYADIRDMWFVCKTCKDKIKDQRQKEDHD